MSPDTTVILKSIDQSFFFIIIFTDSNCFIRVDVLSSLGDEIREKNLVAVQFSTKPLV